jgi:hypothetical protein
MDKREGLSAMKKDTPLLILVLLLFFAVHSMSKYLRIDLDNQYSSLLATKGICERCTESHKIDLELKKCIFEKKQKKCTLENELKKCIEEKEKVEICCTKKISLTSEAD